MTTNHDSYLERALLSLAEMGLFLYRMDEGWIITDSWEYEKDGRPRRAMYSGKPGAASKCRRTIREAIQIKLVDLEEQALSWQKQGQDKIEQCMALREQVEKINAG